MPIFNWTANRSRGAGEKTNRIVWIAGVALTLGMVGVSILLMFSVPTGQAPQLGVGLTSFLVYAASITVGAFLGFLFGLPRARVIDQVTQEGENKSAAKPGLSLSHFLANSNLIKVSDWLTTIIIGLSLVNLGEIVPAAVNLGNALNEPLGSFAWSATVGLTVAIGSFLAGFLLGYLWTSIRVRELLEEAERHAIGMGAFDLTKLTIDEAKVVAARLGYELVIPNGAAGAAVVNSQKPEPGAKMKPGEKIELVL